MSGAFDLVSEWLRSTLAEHALELLYAAFGVAVGLIRAAGKTVVSGTTGLRFSFGRAGRELEPGFYLLVPFLQTVRTLPTRSRTLDLSTQQVTTLDGLVYTIDANLVYRVVDVRRALIEVDELERGMLQMLGLGVQEVLREQNRASMRVSDALDHRLEESLERRLRAWGVVVEHAGFTTITPTAETLRLTQLGQWGQARAHTLAILERETVPRRQALSLLGTRHRFLRRGRYLEEKARIARRRRRVQETLHQIERELLDELHGLTLKRRGIGKPEPRMRPDNSLTNRPDRGRRATERKSAARPGADRPAR